MTLSERELNRQVLRLIRAVIAKTDRDKRKWFGAWDRRLLLEQGYSERIVAKAREFDAKQNVQVNMLFFGMCGFAAFLIPIFIG